MPTIFLSHIRFHNINNTVSILSNDNTLHTNEYIAINISIFFIVRARQSICNCVDVECRIYADIPVCVIVY